jgi:CspA family cold shock protein
MAEKGTVRWFNNKKGYGFIQKESDGKDIFVHYSAITMEGYKTLKTNQGVTFDVVQGDNGPQADKVTPTGEVVPEVTEESAGEKVTASA